MTRSPLAYPLNRSVDADVGGAADLQTDIMRFMAILSLCLVAIFALVQSIPLTPTEPVPAESPTPPQQSVSQPDPDPVPAPTPSAIEKPTSKPVEKAVVLTRPEWKPKYTPGTPAPAEAQAQVTAETPVEEAAPPAEPEQEGFTLRFASDTALTRAVAAQHVGVYALGQGQAKRMTVSQSRISFWDASTPNAFHEMQTSTVPDPVVSALVRTGIPADAVSWGVTLPGKLKSQLESLMQEHRGGSLIIGADGNIYWEAS
jgi:outer membrane biosynthesis protein TonB